MQSIAAIIKHHLATKLIGLEVDGKAAIETVLKSVVNNHTARAALDIALEAHLLKSDGDDAVTGDLRHHKGNPAALLLKHQRLSLHPPGC